MVLSLVTMLIAVTISILFFLGNKRNLWTKFANTLFILAILLNIFLSGIFFLLNKL